MKKYDVFISSKSEDYPIAEEVYRFLIQNGCTVFLASKELERIGDSEYSKAIDDALDECSHLIIVSSKLEHIKSKWVRYEWSTFCDDKKSGFRDGNLLTILDKAIAIAKLPPSLRHQQSFTIDNFRHQILCYLKGQQKSALEDNEHETKLEETTTSIDSTSHTNDEPFIKKNQSSLMSEEITVMEHEHVTCDYQQISDDPIPCNYQPSFPSMFSRFWLFDMAFANLANQPYEGFNQGFMSLLVSECLDLLEFLFLYADHPDLEIRKVSLKGVLSCIESENTLEHQSLAKALEQDLSNLPSFYPNTEVFLFLFGNQIIGGTSPLTLVFTSPQCKTIFQSFPDDFWGIKGQKLFIEYASFGERGEQFQEYMIRLLGVYNRYNSLIKYVRSHSDGIKMRWFDYLSCESPQSRLSQIRSTYPSFYDEQGHEVLIVIEDNIAIPLGHIQTEELVSKEYCICPTLPESSYRTKFGALINLPTPLVLSETGMTGVHYIKNRLWNTAIQFDKDLNNIPLDERVLPGTFLKYPYLVAGDFFEDQIIKLDFKANREMFFLIGDDGNTFLPPIKPFYFRYFTLYDLHHQIICQIDNDNVNVTLNIPIRGNDSMRFISLRHTYNYHNDDIVSIEDCDFRLSVWPAYKLQKNEQNYYSVSVGCNRSVNNVRPRFIRIDSLDGDVNVRWHRIDDIRFCEIGYFDAIQLSVKDAEALIFPLFKEIRNTYSPLRVGIDMGSSSIRISCSEHGHSPLRLDINSGQVMNLNVFHNDSTSCWRTELAEMRMVQEDGEKVALPPYLPAYKNSQLYTGLMHTTVFDSDLAKSFCNQFVWILKNKIVESFGSCDISKVNISLPLCIPTTETDSILNYWNKAFRHHFEDEILIEIVDGNLSLLHFAWAYGQIPSRSSLILDIGKYYTNSAFFEAVQNSMLSNSYPIGISNIWEYELFNYGIRINNKLIDLWKNELMSYSLDERIIIYEAEERMQQHANWMDYLHFQIPECAWKTQQKLFFSSPDLRNLCFLFLAAVIWKVVRELEEKTEKLPDNIIFTGRGFMPFLCFMDKHDLETSVLALFSHFSQKHHHEMTAFYLYNTSAKADGAVLLGSLENCPKVSSLCGIKDFVRSEEININAITNEFMTFIQTLRQFDTTGLLLQLSHICDLFEKDAQHVAKWLQIQYRNDFVSANEAFFWPLKGTIPNAIHEIF